MVGSTHFAAEETEGHMDKDDSQGCSAVAPGLKPKHLPLTWPQRVQTKHIAVEICTPE